MTSNGVCSLKKKSNKQGCSNQAGCVSWLAGLDGFGALFRVGNQLD